jgi:RHS repeat-associated protein
MSSKFVGCLLLAAACMGIATATSAIAAGVEVAPNVGKVMFTQRDHELPTPLGPAAFTRSYDADAAAGLLGAGWRLDIVSELQTVGKSALLLLRSGGVVGFRRTGSSGIFESDTGAHASLSKTEWVIEFAGGAVSHFDAQGRELSRADANGNALTFTYDGKSRLASVRAVDGRPLTLQYYSNDRLASVTDAVGRAATYRYDTAQRLVEATDAKGWTTTYAYDMRGRIAQIAFPDGETVHIAYDAQGRVSDQSSSRSPALTYSYTGNTTKVAQPDGFWRETVYDPQERPIQMRDSAARSQHWSWDASGRLTSILYPDGSTQRYQYDLMGRTIREESGSGDVIEITYRGKTEQPVSITLNSATTKFTHDARGNVLTATSPAGRAALYSYDKAGRVITVADGEGRMTRFEYGADGNVIKQVNPDQSSESWIYDTSGRLIGSVDPSGATTEYQYDAHGLLAAVVAPGGGRSVFEHDSFGRLTAESGAGRTFRYSYDVNGRLSRITYPEGTASSLAYDAAGRPAAWTDALGLVTKKEYDSLGRLIRTVAPGSQAAVTSHDASGRLQSISLGSASGSFAVDQNSRVIQFRNPAGVETRLTLDRVGQVVERALSGGGIERRTYDPDGLIESVTLPSGDTWGYSYDKSGLLAETRFPDGTVEQRSYDAMGRLTVLVSPWGGTAKYRYDGRGLLLEEINARGQAISYQYDAAGRIARKQTPQATWAYSYDSRGNLILATNGKFTIRNSYDAISRLSDVEYVEWGQSVSYEYDASGRVASRTEPGGRKIAYGYDAQGRLARIVNEKGGTFAFSYDASGQLAERKSPNGTVASYAYDAAGRTSSIIHKDASGRTIASRSYSYDQSGHISEVEDENARKTSLRYDADGRLVSEQGAARRSSYVYGAAGNRMAVAGATGSDAYSHDSAGRMTQAGATSFAYDADGNVISRTDATGTTLYGYDAENNLVRVDLPGGKSVVYEYGPFGERISRVENGIRSNLLSDRHGLLQEASDSFRVRTGYLAATEDQPVLQTLSDGKWRVLHEDILGSVIAVSDEKGQPVAHHDFDAFGGLAEPVKPEFANTVRFAGRPLDAATGLYDLRARFYDPRLGRFLTPDPMLGDPARPLTFHAYVYAGNNPVGLVDSGGEAFYTNARGAVWWYPDANELGQDPAQVLQKAFNDPLWGTSGRTTGTNSYVPGLRGNAEAQMGYRNKMNHWGSIIERVMGEEAANNWKQRFVQVTNEYVDHANRTRRGANYQYFYPDQPGPAAVASARPPSVPTPPLASPPLPTRLRSVVPRGSTVAKPSFGERAGEAGTAAGVGLMAIEAANTVGDVWDYTTGWKEGARRTLARRASDMMIASAETLPVKAGFFALGAGANWLAPTVVEAAAPIIAGAGTGLAVLGLTAVAGERVVAAASEIHQWNDASARAEAIQREQEQNAQLRRLQGDFNEILAGVKGKLDELTALRSQAGTAFDEIKQFESEAADGAAAFKTVRSRVESLLAQADEARAQAKAHNATPAGDVAQDGMQQLMRSIEDLRAKACSIPEQMAGANQETQQKFIRDADRYAGEAEKTAAQGRAAVQPEGSGSGSDADLAALKSALLEAEELWQSRGNGRTALTNRLSLIDARIPILRRAVAMQAEVIGHFARLRYFNDARAQVDALRQQAEIAVPPVDEAESLRSSVKTKLDDVEFAQNFMDRRMQEVRAEIQGLESRQTARAAGNPEASAETLRALARQARACSDRARQLAAGTAAPLQTTGGFRVSGGRTTPDSAETPPAGEQTSTTGSTRGFRDYGGSTKPDPTAGGSDTQGGGQSAIDLLGQAQQGTPQNIWDQLKTSPAPGARPNDQAGSGSAQNAQPPASGASSTWQTTIAPGQPAAWHIFATGSRLGWAGGLGQYSVGPADASIIEHLQVAGEHAMWANRESRPPTLAWTGWQNTRNTFRSWADRLQRTPSNEARRQIANQAAAQISPLSQQLNFQTVGTTESRGNCDSVYVRLGFALGYGAQVMGIADEAVRNGNRQASRTERQDAISHLQTADSILADYEGIKVASGRCADLRDVRTQIESIFRLSSADVAAQAAAARNAWELANRRIAELAGESVAPVVIPPISKSAPTPPPQPVFTPPRQEAERFKPRTDGYYLVTQMNTFTILSLRFLTQGTVRVYSDARPSTLHYARDIARDFGPTAIDALKQNKYYGTSDQNYVQEGQRIALRANLDRFKIAVTCKDELDLELMDGGRVIIARYSCYRSNTGYKQIEDELVFVPYDWGQ